MSGQETEEFKSSREDSKVRSYDSPGSKGEKLIQNDEIDLVDLFLTFWKDRKYILYSVIIFIIIGLVIAFTSNEEYTARVRLLPERPQQSVSASLARQFGIGNFQPSTSEGIPTRFYPDIVQSSPFLLPILDKKVYYPEINDSITILNFFSNYYSDITFAKRVSSVIKKYTIQLPVTIVGWFRKKPPVRLAVSDHGNKTEQAGKRESLAIIDISYQQQRAITRLRSRIKVDNQDGIINLSAIMPEPEMAADLVNYSTNSLIEFIKNYLTEKSKTDLLFVEERFHEAQIRFKMSQENLARFRDENRGQLTQMARTEEQRLQSEYELAFNVYNTLARRMEEARLDLQQETPVVKVLEPAVIPTIISQPRREFIMLIYTFLGVITGFVLIFIKQVHKRIKNSIRTRENN